MNSQIRIRDELAAFHKAIQARALLIAIDWAGSASTLAELIGYTRHAGVQWLRRGRLPVEAASRLARIQGFPMAFQEMCPAMRTDHLQCKSCGHVIKLQGERTGYLPSFNGNSKSVREARRKQAAHAARRHTPDAPTGS